MRNYEPILEILESHERFLLTSHLFPDGDGLGSALALAGGLRKLGKDARVVMPSPPPVRYAFLDPARELACWTSRMRSADLADRQVAIVLDCSSWERLSALGGLLAELPLVKVCLDHHKASCDFADVALLDPAAPATAEMVYELVRERCGLALDPTMARAIYAALVTETGGFQFSNTSARVHRISAELLEDGVDAERVNLELNQRNPPHSIPFLARALETFATGAGGRMAWLAIGPEIFQATGATAEDTVGLVAYPRSVEGVELALMFFEDEPESVKISFRSKSWLDVSELARQFGGGGHARAAGALVRASLAEAVARVARAGEEALGSTEKGGTGTRELSD